MIWKYFPVSTVFSHFAPFVYLYYFGFDVNCNSVFANERLSTSWGLKDFHFSYGENRKVNWFFPHIRKCVIARFAKWNISMMWINIQQRWHYHCKLSRNTQQFILNQFILGQFILEKFILRQFILRDSLSSNQFILRQFILRDSLSSKQFSLRINFFEDKLSQDKLSQDKLSSGDV